MKNLYLFTARYPYKGVENFLEDEIEYLSKVFDKIYVIPFKANDNGKRDMPFNCKLQQPILHGWINFGVKAIFNKKSFLLLFKEFFKKKVFLSWKRFKVWVTAYCVSNSILNTSSLKKIMNQLKNDDVCYFYWGKWSNVLSIFWVGKAHFISRFHGEWDLWEETYDGYAPLRNYLEDSLDYAVFIAKKGEWYFNQRYPKCKTKVFRLGTQDIGTSKESSDGWVRILSCSTIYPLKRVDLICKSIAEASKKLNIEWTHIGGGEDYVKIKSLANSLETLNFRYNLVGQVSYKDVLEYYQKHTVDLFINLSTNEGVPVSIMEAISCDVPIVATSVGGNTEIVCPYTGILVSANPTKEEVAQAIVNVLSNRGNYQPRNFWKSTYQADNNYSQFALFLEQL